MEIDMLTVETDCIIRDMGKIKTLCFEAYNKTDDIDEKTKIQMMYEGKIFEKVKLFFISVTASLGKGFQHIEDFERRVFAVPRTLFDKAFAAVVNKKDSTIENYQEFDVKAYYDLWQKLHVIKSVAKLKSSNEINMDDSDIKELLETAKNVGSLRKQWAQSLMTKPRTIKYSEIGIHNRNYIVNRYKDTIASLKGTTKSLQDDINAIAKKANGSADTMKVARAATTVTNAITSVVISCVNKDLSIQEKCFKQWGAHTIKL